MKTMSGDAMTGVPALLDAKILIADDQACNVELLEKMLRDAGYSRVSSTMDPREVCALHAKNAYDLILLDLIMPGVDGFEVMEGLCNIESDSYLPVIVLTVEPAHRLRALQAGAKDFVVMPLDLVEVQTRIHNMLEVRLLHNRLATYNHLLEEGNRDLERASRYKSEFLSMMSHELRTPLNAIIGFAELLKMGLGGEMAGRQLEFAGYIADSGKHLLSLINEVLDLSKIEAGKMELHLEAVDLDALLQRSMDMVRESALRQEVHLEFHGSGEADSLQVDPRRLKQIAYNLLSNAIKFSKGGRVSLRSDCVDRRQASEDLPGFEAGVRMPLPSSDFQRFAQISVADSGIGLSREDMARLFTPFTQIKNSATHSMEGTGLGLVAVSRLAQLHGGAVAVTSSPGTGSCFSVWLPWRSAGDPHPTSATIPG